MFCCALLYNRNIYLCEDTRRFILVHISRRTHSYSYSSYTIMNLYIYIDGGTYPHTHIYLKVILVSSSLRSYRTYADTEVLIYLRSLVGVYRDITECILVLQNLSLYGSTRKYYLFKCTKRRTLVLISNLSYTYTGVPVGTTEFILIRSLYEDTRRYYRTHTYSCISDLILVFQILYMYYRTYTCLTKLILALQS